jgi:hypothetical protein
MMNPKNPPSISTSCGGFNSYLPWPQYYVGAGAAGTTRRWEEQIRMILLVLIVYSNSSYYY